MSSVQARRREFGLDRFELVARDGQHAGAAPQDVEIVLDRHAELRHLFGDLVAAQCSQALQAQVENGFGLLFAETDRAFAMMAWRGSAMRVTSGPTSLPASPVPSIFAGGGDVGGGADERDDFVDIGDGDGKTDQDMAAVAGT